LSERFANYNPEISRSNVYEIAIIEHANNEMKIINCTLTWVYLISGEVMGFGCPAMSVDTFG